MINDKDSDVRITVAKRLPEEYLFEMMDDRDPDVRSEIVYKIDPVYLPHMAKDKNDHIRLIAERRLMQHRDKKPITAQLKQNYDYGDGFYAEMNDGKVKSVDDFRKKRRNKRKKILKKIRDMKLK
jgi:hypothetical protein